VPNGAGLDLIEFHGIPVFDQENEMTLSATVLEFKRRILAANVILFAMSAHNHSLPGRLKNVIDWAHGCMARAPDRANRRHSWGLLPEAWERPSRNTLFGKSSSR